MLITDREKIERYYQALLARRSDYVGIFFVGVKTTGVFCIATCRARKPKLCNVEFYTSATAAVERGYRPCKICRPTTHAQSAPPQIEAALNLLKRSPSEKVSDQQLRDHGIRPERVRRWFKQHHGMTFHAYQRMQRMSFAHQDVRQGRRVTDAAFDQGYESLSGFGYAYKKVVGQSPLQSVEQNILISHRISTRLGSMLIGATDRGICLLEFTDRPILDQEMAQLRHLFSAEIIAGKNQHIVQAVEELDAYFNGRRRWFDVPIDAPGTLFQQLVWHALREIPYGETVSYKQQAIRIGKPNAARAVAAANRLNRIAIIIPCHRVIGKNGALRGYGGGLERKRWLIEHEKRHLAS